MLQYAPLIILLYLSSSDNTVDLSSISTHICIKSFDHSRHFGETIIFTLSFFEQLTLAYQIVNVIDSYTGG